MNELNTGNDEDFDFNSDELEQGINLTSPLGDPDDTQEVDVHAYTSSEATENRIESFVDDLKADMRHGLVALGQKVTKLEKHFETKIMYDQSKDQTIDALHNELQDYREGLQFKHLRPLVHDLLTLYDDLSELLGRFEVEHAETAALEPVGILLQNVETIRADMASLLDKYGFELYEYPGEEIDRRFQRVQGTVITHDPVLDRLLAERVHAGLRYEDRVIRPEIVKAYKFVPA